MRRRALSAVVAVATLASLTSATYRVAPGDTLSQIASRLGVAPAALAEANRIDDPDRIRAGQRLRVPGAAVTYTVAPGDALSRVASRHGVTLRALRESNAIGDPNRILVGQVLTIPTGAGPGLEEPAPARAPRPVDRAAPGQVIDRVARAYGWNPSFVKALAWQESGWQMTRRSAAGAVGIMQVMPGTGDFVSRRLVGRRLDLADATDNVTAGVAFLDYLYDLTGGDAEATLAGYYQGLASVRRNGRYASTDRYIANVLALRSRF